MRARAWSVVGVLAIAGIASADPKPKPVDIKPIRDKLIVLTDAEGGTYVAMPGKDARLWYGAPKSKALYEQIVISRSENQGEGTWDLGVWAPRVPNIQPGAILRKADGTFERYCGGDHTLALTPASADQSKTILDKSQFLTTAMIRRPHMLARDDAGIYYYVDVIRDQYGGKGYRVFVGKKGAMKQRPLTDIATDTAGDVFGTKTGDLRIVRDSDKDTITWVKGDKRTTLSRLDTDASSVLIFRDLGVYTFIGSICESVD